MYSLTSPPQILGKIKLCVYDLSKTLGIVEKCFVVAVNGIFGSLGQFEGFYVYAD